MHIRCSGLARPMKCAGFVFLDLPDSGTNAAAEQGTAAGEYLERLLTGQQVGTVSSKGYYFDDDMKFYIEPIAEEIKSRASTEVLCEQRIDWQNASGIWIKGQYDIAFVDHQGTLCIEDLKYGFGIVDVEENWQLLAYAIGEVIRRGQAFNKISLKIHQPRPHHEEGSTREWILSYPELLAYKDKIEARTQKLVDGYRDFQTGSHCKYCMGAAEACTAFNRLFNDSLEFSTSFFQDSINNDELSRQLDQVQRAEEVLRIKKDSITELGTIRIKAGQIIKGYVQSDRYGNRTWKSGVTPEVIESLTGKKVIENTFMTPAKVQKLGVSKNLIEQFANKKFIGTKLEKKDSSELGNKIFGNKNP